MSMTEIENMISRNIVTLYFYLAKHLAKDIYDYSMTFGIYQISLNYNNQFDKVFQ